MFRQLPGFLSRVFDGDFAPALTGGAAELFNRHPLELVAYMEAYWSKATSTSDKSLPLGHPNHRSDEQALPAPPLPATRLPIRSGEFLFGSDGTRVVPGGILRWDHLIYAYMIENTRIYEIFRRVVHEYRHGEKLGTPQDTDTQN